MFVVVVVVVVACFSLRGSIKIARIFLGIGEAFNAPACYALITLYFPHSRRATANGIYSTGTYLGSALSSLCLALAVVLGELRDSGQQQYCICCQRLRAGVYDIIRVDRNLSGTASGPAQPAVQQCELLV